MTYDKIAGVLFGQAVGDALGLPAEHRTAEWCAEKYPDGGPFGFERVERLSRGEVFEAGDVSDDTDQSLILVDSWLEHRSVNAQDIARRLLDWAKTQRGMGSHTRAVLAHDLFGLNPEEAAYDVWNSGGRKAAPNGAVMRSAVCGLFVNGLEETWTAAKACARVTHYDPRCQVAAAKVAGLVHQLARGETIQNALREVGRLQALDPLGYVESEVPSSWDGPDQGFTYTPLHAATLALLTFDSLMPLAHEHEALTRMLLSRVVRYGGDTDTNAAVTGAVLGALVGFDRLPFIAGLRNTDALSERAEALWRLK